MPGTTLPDHAPGSVLIRITEDADVTAVLRQSNLTGAATARTQDPTRVLERSRQRASLSRGADGLYHFRGRRYRSVEEIPAADLFQDTYDRMGPRERALYRNHLVRLPHGLSVGRAIEALASNPHVEYAEPNYLATGTLVPNDPLYGQQWSHLNTQAGNGWDVESGDPGVTLAIVDTGVDYLHEDLAANIWTDPLGTPGRDFVDLDTAAYVAAGFDLVAGEDYVQIDEDPSDVDGHGSHVAGVAAAAGNNATGVTGVCQHCRIMPVRAGFSIRAGPLTRAMFEIDDVAAAITHAADSGADVINMSFGSTRPSRTLEDAIDYAFHTAGVVLVAGAGNIGLDVRSYPAAYDNVIAVAATTIDDGKAYYSSHGVWVDVAAPGGDKLRDPQILSTVPRAGTLGDPGGYRCLEGTSMASSYVTGLAGLILSRYGGLYPLQVQQILRHAVDAPRTGDYIGTGRVNVDIAMGLPGAPDAIAEIHSPASGDFLPASPVEIRGTALGDGYVLEISQDPYATAWTTFDSGTTVIDGILGTLDPRGLETGKDYFIRLTVSDTIEVTDLIKVSYNELLRAGWPQSTATSILASPVLHDLDHDGKQEIVLTTHAYGAGESFGGMVFVWRTDGSAYPGWPVTLAAGPLPASPAAADVDLDGLGEIVAAGWAGIFLFNHDGSTRAGWPKPNYAFQSPTLADLDHDGDLEIIVPADDWPENQIYAWHHDGSMVAGWPQPLQGAGPAAAADLDGDGMPEVIAGTSGTDYSGARSEPQAVHAWHGDGTPAAGWPRPVSGWVEAPPVSGDIDRDGDPEIVVASGAAIHAWHHDGDLVAGFPLVLDEIALNVPPILADLDGDTDLEILFARGLIGSNSLLEAYHHDGTPVAGWPVSVPPTAAGFNTGAMQFVAGDIDGDRSPEVVAKAWDRLFAWHQDGTPVTGFPFFAGDVGHTATTSPFPAISDIDGDGRVEVVCATNFDRVFVYDLPAPLAPAAIDWPMYQHDARHSGSYDGFCGDGVQRTGEACDDGNVASGDGCDSDCSPTGCGNGIVSGAEQCDDGNLEAGDCCSPACTLEPPDTPCNDGNPCTLADGCTPAGACRGSEEPDPACRRPTSARWSRLTIMNRGRDQFDKLAWRWQGDAGTRVAEYGSPLTTTGYAICMYDRPGGSSTLRLGVSVPASGTCGTRPCWSTWHSSAYRYRDVGHATPSGIRAMTLRGGDSLSAQITVRGRGARLNLPEMPLEPPVTVQVRNMETGVCWGADFDLNVFTNTSRQFRARND